MNRSITALLAIVDMRASMRCAALVACALLCARCWDGDPAGPRNPPEDPTVQFTWWPPRLLQRDPVTVMKGSIGGDVLFLLAAHGGGCGNHAFKLYMQPTFMESLPVQTNLYLQHTNIEDHCEAMITSEPSFDIRPIAELYARLYGGYDDIVLNVYGYFEDEPADKISLTYSPRAVAH